MTHPWILLWTRIKQQGRTQKQFAVLAWKKVSEVNELIKGKRNITIPRDFTLHNVLWTEQKYRIDKQLDFDYQNFLASIPTKIPLPPTEQSPKEQAPLTDQEENLPPLPDDTVLLPPQQLPPRQPQTTQHLSQKDPLVETETLTWSWTKESTPERDPQAELLKEKAKIFRDF